jgi:hypothetical protein
VTAADKLMVALLDGAVIRARKLTPFAATKYTVVARTYDEILGEQVQREQFEVSENVVSRLAKQGTLDTREAVKTFTANATEYTITLTPAGIDTARGVKLSAMEVARAS